MPPPPHPKKLKFQVDESSALGAVWGSPFALPTLSLTPSPPPSSLSAKPAPGCLCSAYWHWQASGLRVNPIPVSQACTRLSMLCLLALASLTLKLTPVTAGRAQTSQQPQCAPAHRARGGKTHQNLDRTLDRPHALFACARRAPFTIRAWSAAWH